MPLWIAPWSLLPAITLDWASKANTRNFIDVPSDEFLGPPSEIKVLTRILCPNYYIYIFATIMPNIAPPITSNGV